MSTRSRRLAIGITVCAGLIAGSVTEVPADSLDYSLADALSVGLANNLALRQMQLDVRAAEQGIFESKATYDTRFTGSAIYSDSELPSQTTVVESGSESTIVSLGLAKALASGTELGFEAGTRSFLFSEAPEGSIDEINISSIAFSARQSLLKNAFGGRDRARVEAAVFGYERARLQYLYQRDALAADIYEAFWNAHAAQKNYEVEEGAVERSRELLKINRAKFKDGLLDETDILAAEASLATREVVVLSQRDAVATSRDNLVRILNLPPRAWDEAIFLFASSLSQVEGDEDTDALAAYETAQAYRSDLAALQRERKQVVLEREVARQEIRPDLALLGRVEVGDAQPDLSDSYSTDRMSWSVGVQLELPWERRAEKSALRRAELQLEQIDQRIAELDQVILWECRRAARNLSTALQEVSASERARDLHREKLKQEEAKWGQGRSSTRIVIEYQNDLEFAERILVRAQSGLQKAWAFYRLVQGILLTEEEW